MHICILNEFFYPDKTGGTPQKLSELSTKLRSRHNDEVTVVTSSNSYRNLKIKYPPFETWNGIKIHRVDGPHWSEKRIAQRLLGNIVFTRRASRFALRNVSCDVLLVSSAPPILPMAAQVYRNQHHVPYVYYVADLDPDRAVAIGAVPEDSFPARLLRKHQRQWLHGAHKVVVLGRCMRDVIMERYGVPQERVEVVEVGTDAEAIQPLGRDTRFRRDHRIDGFVVMYTGSFGKYHDFDTILDAAKLLQARQPKVSFVLVGRGAKKESVKSRISAESIDNVRLFDFVPEEDYADLLATADACLVTLDPGMEGLCVPGKFYSIMAAGRPTLAVIPPKNEVAYALADDDMGMLIKLGDSASLADAISAMANDPERTAAQGRRARSVFEARYTTDIIADHFREVLVSAWKSTQNGSQ